MREREREKSEGSVKIKPKVKVKGGVLGLSGRRILIFLLEFMAVSAVFLAVWYYIGELYQGAIFFFAKHIWLAMGYTPLQISAVNLSGAYLVNFNLVPLVALAIATPGWGLRERGEMLVIGVPLLFLLHVLDTVAHLPYFYEMLMQSPGFATLIAYSIGVGGVAMPFIIWFALFFRKETCTSTFFLKKEPVLRKKKKRCKGGK